MRFTILDLRFTISLRLPIVNRKSKIQNGEDTMPVSPDKDPYYRLRHSAAHVMAEAVLEEFPAGKLAIGPPIEDGFYYDFELPRPLTPEDLAAIEARMRRIIAGDFPFVYREVSAEAARTLFA